MLEEEGWTQKRLFTPSSSPSSSSSSLGLFFSDDDGEDEDGRKEGVEAKASVPAR